MEKNIKDGKVIRLKVKYDSDGGCVKTKILINHEEHEVHEGQNFLGNFLFFFVSFALFVVKRMLLHSP